ncbi:MAG: hypothetical protein AAFV80_23710, partial [Bacteroidota bacterium]
MNLDTKFRFYRKMVYVFLVSIIFQTAFPLGAFALTSGPSQPEFQEFEPVTTTQMVDLFSGDFTYNIPLFELPGPEGGYPFNLSYHSGITMDQEASWVGLGWTLNHGAINRSMRGLPDEFNGDIVRKKLDMKNNQTWGVGPRADFELFGSESPGFGGLSLGLGFKVMYNSYKGVGLSLDPSIGFKFNSEKKKGGISHQIQEI